MQLWLMSYCQLLKRLARATLANQTRTLFMKFQPSSEKRGGTYFRQHFCFINSSRQSCSKCDQGLSEARIFEKPTAARKFEK